MDAARGQAGVEGEMRPTKVYAGFRALEDVIFEDLLESMEEESKGRIQFKVVHAALFDDF